MGVRKIWSRYYEETNGVVFVVDGADPDRFEEARESIDRCLEDEKLAKLPMLILLNKCVSHLIK